MASTTAGVKRPFMTMALEHVMDSSGPDSNARLNLQTSCTSTSSDGDSHTPKRPFRASSSFDKGVKSSRACLLMLCCSVSDFLSRHLFIIITHSRVVSSPGVPEVVEAVQGRCLSCAGGHPGGGKINSGRDRLYCFETESRRRREGLPGGDGPLESCL